MGHLEKEVPSTMAIQDRNLSVGTKLYARYKGQTYTAEVIEKEGGTAYRLADGREFKSPSAAGTAITKKRPAATITPAPQPQTKGRGKKGQPAEPPANDDQGGDEARDDAPTAAQDDGQPVTCAECHETFPGVQAATEHYYATHGKADEPTE